MTKCPFPSSRTACLISSLLSNYSYVDYNKRFISFATNEKVDALSRLLTISILAEWCCRFSSDLILKIPIWNMLINLLYCIVLFCIALYCIVLYCIVLQSVKIQSGLIMSLEKKPSENGYTVTWYLRGTNSVCRNQTQQLANCN